VDHVQLGSDPKREPGGAVHERLAARPRHNSHHDPLGRLPHRGWLVLAKVLEQFLVGLVGQEPQRQLAERDQVVQKKWVSA